MKVVILCGGLGTRLREETEFRPKPMVKIGRRPILWHIMRIYAEHGFREFVLALGYKGDAIKDYFCHYELMNNDVTLELGKPDSMILHNGSKRMDWKITLSDTGEKTFKGARVKRVAKYIEGDTFMLTYGDGVGDINVKELLEFHKSHGKLATVTGVNAISRFGELTVKNQLVTNFSEKPENYNKGYINGGYFVFQREFLDLLSEDPACDLEYGPLEQIAKEGQMMVYKHEGFWACMDTYRDVEYLNGLWSEDRAPWKTW